MENSSKSSSTLLLFVLACSFSQPVLPLLTWERSRGNVHVAGAHPRVWLDLGGKGARATALQKQREQVREAPAVLRGNITVRI